MAKITLKYTIYAGEQKGAEYSISASTRKGVFKLFARLDANQDVHYVRAAQMNPEKIISIRDITIIEANRERKSQPHSSLTHSHRNGQTYSRASYSRTFCQNCGRRLTDPESVNRGIGPECAKKIIKTTESPTEVSN
jgi:hypothetical protein